jgi:O-antigen/teichoic acid export membrane protein
LAAIPFVVGLNTVFGSLTMINFGLKKQFTLILMICGALNVGLLLVLASAYGAVGAASAVLITEIGVTLTMGVYVWRRRLL